jgi:hypothetical protein
MLSRGEITPPCGLGANLWRFVNPLVSAGFSVTAFDGWRVERQSYESGPFR